MSVYWNCPQDDQLVYVKCQMIICQCYITGVGSGGARGACAPPTFLIGGGNGMFVPPPPLLTPHFYFPLELYVYITLTNNYLAFFIYQLIILWTISINWHRWLLLNNHTSKYNSFILVLYRRYKNHVSVYPPPPHHHHHTFWHIATPLYVFCCFLCVVCVVVCLFVVVLMKAEHIIFSNHFVMMTQVCAKISNSNSKVNVHLTRFFFGFCQIFQLKFSPKGTFCLFDRN